MKKLNKKGFTLIELLAVIIILGVLMIIAIPSVTTYIQNSRKSAWTDTGVSYAKAVVNKANEGGKLQFFTTRTLYMVPVGHVKGTACVSVESGGQSPFSESWAYAYVGVLYDGSGYQYYYIAEDGAGQGIDFVTQQFLNKDGADYMYTKSKIPTGEGSTGDGHVILKGEYETHDGSYTKLNTDSTNWATFHHCTTSNDKVTCDGVLDITPDHLLSDEKSPEYDTIIIVHTPSNEDSPCAYKNTD